jgi:monooxygenase
VRGNPSRSDAASAAIAKMPKQGSKRPWRLYQNYALDIVTLRYDKVDAGVMQYS